MVKYGHYLESISRDAPLCWQGMFIRYKLLKKTLKECRLQAAAAADGDASGGEEPGSATPPAALPAAAPATAAEAAAAAAHLRGAEARFFELLEGELLKANRCFVSNAEAIVAAYQRMEMRRRLACCFPRLLAAGPARYADLAERAYWCRKYARANAVALRKILKKYDKLRGGQRGRNFLQHCWRLPSGGAFLHSPLLDELKAIQDMLQEQRMQREDIQLCEVADTSGKGGSKAAAAMAAAAGGAGRQPGAIKGALVAAAAGQGAVLPCGCPASMPAASGGDSAASLGTVQQHLQRDSSGASSAAGGCCASHTHLEACTTLAAIIESPTCMMSSSDFEWAAEDGRQGGGLGGEFGGGGSGGGGGGDSSSVATRQRHSLDASMFSSGGPLSVSTSFSPGTSPPGPGVGGLLPPRAASQSDAAAGLTGEAGGQPQIPRPGSSRFRDEELHCPICLDVMYKPVGLSCGHKFCKQCAVEHAGLRRALGTFSNLCSYVSPAVVCPQCRQPAVYREAVRMRQLDRVLKARYPREWAERRVEERARERALVEEAARSPASPTRGWLYALSARDSLVAI